MKYYDLHADALAESDYEDLNDTLDSWTLNDFSDLCDGAERAAATPVGDENLAYPS